MAHLLGEMDPALAAPLATLAGAIATAIIMWASYNYPRGYHRRGAEKDEDREIELRRKGEDDATTLRRASEDAELARTRGGHDVERIHEREDEDLAVKRQRLDVVPPDPNKDWDHPETTEPVAEEPTLEPPVRRRPRRKKIQPDDDGA